MSAPRLRTVVISQYASALRGIVRVCRAQGHTPVAAICTRTELPHGGVSSPQMKSLAKAIVGACPSGMDVCVVNGIEPLAGLVESYVPDLLIVRGFPWKLPPRVLDVAGYGSVNLHPSALPEFRGSFPVHWAIRRGDSRLAVTAHRMDAEFDTGPVLATVPFDVPQEDFGPAIWSRVDRAAERALDVALGRVIAREPGDPQNDHYATYAGAFGASDQKVHWGRSAAEIHNLVRAWSLGSPSALGGEGPVADLDGVPVRVVRTSLTEIDAPQVTCGDGPIWLAHVQELGHSSTPGASNERSG